MMLEELMINPVVWTVLSLVTIVSLVYAIFVQQKNKEKKMFSYVKKSNVLIWDKKSKFDKLSVLYDGNHIDSLCVSNFVIWNSGNKPLRRTDMVSSKELTISVANDNRILDAKILKVSEVTNEFELKNIDEQTIKIEFDYADKKDGVVIQIIHTGSEEAISIDCKIIGGLPMKNEINDSTPKFVAKVFDSKAFFNFSCVCISLTMIFNALLALLFTIAIFNANLQQFLFSQQNTLFVESQNETIICAVLLWFFFLFLSSIYFPTIKKVFGVGVPKSLKNAKLLSNK